MRKLISGSKTVRTGLAIILVLLLIFGSALSTLAAPKHDNTNERAIEAVENGGQGKGQGIVNSKNPNSALHGNGTQESTEDNSATNDDVTPVTENGGETTPQDPGTSPGNGQNGDTGSGSGNESSSSSQNQSGNQSGGNGQQPDETELGTVGNENDNQVTPVTEEGSQESGTEEEVETGSDDGVIDIQTDQVPQGVAVISSVSNETEEEGDIFITDSQIPLSAPDLDRVIILDEEVPQSAPSLPQTGDANPLIMVITGLGMAASGLSIRRRQRYTTSSVTTLFQDK